MPVVVSKWIVDLRETYSQEKIIKIANRLHIDEEIQEYWFSDGNKEILWRNYEQFDLIQMRQYQGDQVEKLIAHLLETTNKFHVLMKKDCNSIRYDINKNVMSRFIEKNELKKIRTPMHLFLDMIGFSSPSSPFKKPFYEIEVKSCTTQFGPASWLSMSQRMYMESICRHPILVIDLWFRPDEVTIRYRHLNQRFRHPFVPSPERNGLWDLCPQYRCIK